MIPTTKSHHHQSPPPPFLLLRLVTIFIFILALIVTATALLPSAVTIIAQDDKSAHARSAQYEPEYFDDLAMTDHIRNRNNRTTDQCDIGNAHDWNPMQCMTLENSPPLPVLRSNPWKISPSIEVVEQCVWHYYHPSEVQPFTHHLLNTLKQELLLLHRVNATNDPLLLTVGQTSTRTEIITDSSTFIARKQVFLLAGESGIGKMDLIETLLPLVSNPDNINNNTHQQSSGNKEHEKNVILELDCDHTEKGRISEDKVVSFIRRIEVYIKKDPPIPFIVFKNLQKCSKRTINGFIVPVIAPHRHENQLSKMYRSLLPPTTTIFITMNTGSIFVGRTSKNLKHEEIFARTEKTIIHKYGKTFRDLVSIHSFSKTWNQNQYFWALKRQLDSIPCHANNSKVGKISYSRAALRSLAVAFTEYHDLVTTVRFASRDFKNGRIVTMFVKNDVEPKIHRAIVEHEEKKLIRKEEELRKMTEEGGFLAYFFSLLLFSPARYIKTDFSIDKDNKYTVVILKSGSFVEDKYKLNIEVFEEGTAAPKNNNNNNKGGCTVASELDNNEAENDDDNN